MITMIALPKIIDDNNDRNDDDDERMSNQCLGNLLTAAIRDTH